jgi:hypothetical protein
MVHLLSTSEKIIDTKMNGNKGTLTPDMKKVKEKLGEAIDDMDSFD